MLKIKTKKNDTELEPLEEKKIYDRLGFTMFICFIVPFAALFTIHSFLEVFPVGNNSVLVLDMNAQYVYFFEELRDVLTGGQSIIYSFNRNLGGEFLGMIAYYLSSPFSLIVALFPKDMITEAIYFIILLKAGFSGMTFGFLLKKTRNLKLSHCVVFSTAYALCSFCVVMQHNVMWTDNIIAFPLMIYAIDEVIRHRKFKMYVITLAYCLISNFYIGYMTCIFVFVWYFVRYLSLMPDERNPEHQKLHFIWSSLRILAASVIAVMIAAIMILPAYYSLSFGKLEFSNPDYTPKQLYEFADLLSKSFYGTYDTVRPEGIPFLFCSSAVMILSPLYFFIKKIPARRKIAYGFMSIFFIVSMNFSVLDIVWHGFQRPNWLNARFTFMFMGLLIIMAVDVFRNLSEIGFKSVIISAFAWAILLIILSKIGYDHFDTFYTVWFGLLFLIIICALISGYARNKGKPVTGMVISLALAVITVTEMVTNGLIMLNGLDKDVVISNRDSYRTFIDKYYKAAELLPHEDDSFYRAEKLAHRNKNDNFALDLNGLTNSTSTLNKKVIDLLKKFGYDSRSHWSFYSGATAVSDAIFDIKYIMADESEKKPVMSYIHDSYSKLNSTDDGVDIYENPYALSIAYAVNRNTAEYDLPYVLPPDGGYEVYVDPFTYMNELLTSMTGENIEIWTKADLDSTTYEGCTPTATTGHRGYKKESGETATVTYKVNITSDKPLYVYFPSSYPRKATMYLDGVKLCTYFDTKEFSIRELGTYNDGDTIKIDLTLQQDNLYIRNDADFFWYFDMEEFERAVDLLSRGVMDVHSDADHHLTGTIDVPEDKTLIFTTIPYDKGWHVKVDGKDTETIAVLDEALLAFYTTPGKHAVEMSYFSDAVKYGIIISAVGIILFLLWCIAAFIIKKMNADRGISEAKYPYPDLRYSDEDYLTRSCGDDVSEHKTADADSVQTGEVSDDAKQLELQEIPELNMLDSYDDTDEDPDIPLDFGDHPKEPDDDPEIMLDDEPANFDAKKIFEELEKLDEAEQTIQLGELDGINDRTDMTK